MVHETLSRKYPMRKRTGGVSQVVERLLSKLEALCPEHSRIGD
jgi:hypothetical protein